MRKHLKNYFIPHEENDYKPHSVRLLPLIATVSFAIVITLATMIATTNTSRNTFLADVQAAFLTQLTSDARVERKLAALTEDPLLVEAAHLKARDMIENQYFAHNSPRGVKPWYWFEKVGYDYQYAGENLAIDFYDTKKVAQAWMDSPAHRANILNGNYTDIGIAVEVGQYQGRRVAFVVQMFGKKKSAPAIPLANNLIATLPRTETPEEEPDEQVLGESVQESEPEEPAPVVVNELPEVIEAEPETAPVLAAEATAEKETIKTPYLQTQTSDLGKIILLILVGLLSLSLMLKIFIEMKKQHWKHVAMATGALLIVIALYIILTIYTGQVTIV